MCVVCVYGYVGVFVCEQMKKVFVCACEFVQQSVCVCVCWHIWVLQSIIELKVAIETRFLSHTATDTGLHLIYT